MKKRIVGLLLICLALTGCGEQTVIDKKDVGGPVKDAFESLIPEDKPTSAVEAVEEAAKVAEKGAEVAVAGMTPSHEDISKGQMSADDEYLLRAAEAEKFIVDWSEKHELDMSYSESDPNTYAYGYKDYGIKYAKDEIKETSNYMTILGDRIAIGMTAQELIDMGWEAVPEVDYSDEVGIPVDDSVYCEFRKDGMSIFTGVMNNQEEAIIVDNGRIYWINVHIAYCEDCEYAGYKIGMSFDDFEGKASEPSALSSSRSLITYLYNGDNPYTDIDSTMIFAMDHDRVLESIKITGPFHEKSVNN